jgi:hypothetical protein
VVQAPPATEAAVPGDGAGLDFDRVINAHGQWKTKFRAAITRQESVEAANISRDDRCELGRWIYGSGRSVFGHRPVFDQLIQEHKQFHLCAGEVAHAIDQRRFEAAMQMIDSKSRFSEASKQVMNTLSRMKRIEV